MEQLITRSCCTYAEGDRLNNKIFRFFLTTVVAIGLSACIEVSKEEQVQISSSSTGTLLKPLATSYHMTCVVSSAGALKCWGNNAEGQLGQGDTVTRGETANEMGSNLTPINVGSGRTVKSFSMGDYHVCAILDNNKVKCWGWNGAGELGLGDTVTRGDNANEMGNNLPYVDLGTGRTAKAISAGGSHTCAILDNDKLKCWGYNTDGELGNESTANVGDQANQMGDNLPYVNLGTGRTVKVISAAGHNTCALLDNNDVKCWGHNGFGQLGVGHNSGFTHNAGSMGDNLAPIDLGTGRTAKTVIAGGFYNCAILDNDKLKCWGRNNNGQLGLGDTSDRGDQANEMGDNLAYINLGTNKTIDSVSLFYDHACAVLTDKTMKCWGYNDVGQLGLGDTNNRGDNANEMGDNLPTISLGTGYTAKAVAAGHAHSCVILNTDDIKCWGNGWLGALGYENGNSAGFTSGQMGDNLPVVNTGF